MDELDIFIEELEEFFETPDLQFEHQLEGADKTMFTNQMLDTGLDEEYQNETSLLIECPNDQCSAYICNDCMREWLHDHNSCPICHTPINTPVNNGVNNDVNTFFIE